MWCRRRVERGIDVKSRVDVKKLCATKTDDRQLVHTLARAIVFSRLSLATPSRPSRDGKPIPSRFQATNLVRVTVTDTVTLIRLSCTRMSVGHEGPALDGPGPGDGR